MHKFIISILLIVTLGCGGGGGSDSCTTVFDGDNKIEHIGFYHDQTSWGGSHLKDIFDFVNVSYVQANDHEPYILEAIKYDTPLILDMTGTFWDSNAKAFYPTYLERWEEKKALYKKYTVDVNCKDPVTILAFYIDEPGLQGMSWWDRDIILNLMATDFPTVERWATFWDSEKGEVHPLWDAISYTPDYDKTSACEYKEKLEHMKRIMHPHQYLFITADTVLFDGYNVYHDEYKADVLREYFNLSKAMPEVGAMLMFLYPDTPWDNGVGAMSMPETLTEAYNIGMEVTTQ
jgi:hypothetical protein